MFRVLRVGRGRIARVESTQASRSSVPSPLSWLGRNRRLAKDFENLAETLATFVTLASIQLALRPLTRAYVVN
jgi:hypothetical protein